MAGHSQFKNIMHKKGQAGRDPLQALFKTCARNHRRGQMGLPDPAMNARLRAAVLAARAENMPKDNIERAIKKASGADGENYDEVRYEGYAPGRSGRDRRGPHRQSQPHGGRSAPRISPRPAGSLAETGAVSFMFDRAGSLSTAAASPTTRRCWKPRLKPAADDVVSGPEEHEIVTSVESLAEAQKALEAKFGEPRKASLVWRPQNTISGR